MMRQRLSLYRSFHSLIIPHNLSYVGLSQGFHRITKEADKVMEKLLNLKDSVHAIDTEATELWKDDGSIFLNKPWRDLFNF